MRDPFVKHVVALGGGVGTGKALALGILKQLGYETIDADQLTHELTIKGTPGYQQIVARLGAAVLDSGGWIDRSKVYGGSRTDPTIRQNMQAVVAPLLRHELAQRIRKSRAALVFIKTGNLDAEFVRELCDRVWLLEASPQVCFQNLMDEHGWTRALAEGYVRSHAHVHSRTVSPDLVLENSGARRDFWMRIAEAARTLETEPTRHSLSMPAAATVAVGEAGELAMHALPEQPGPHWAAVEGVSVTAQPDLGAPTHVTAQRLVPKRLAADARTRGSATARVKPRRESVGRAELRLLGSRAWSAALTLLAIAYLTSWGLILAEHGREHTPMLPLQAAAQALGRTVQYIVQHPQSYFRFGEQVPWLTLVAGTLRNSAGLLLLSMAVALLVGLPLGIAAAAARNRTSSAFMVLASLLGISTASFLFAMMLWVVNIWVHRTFNIQVLPSAGFGWDGHLVMPVIVLAMRPLAQLAQVTYVTMREVLTQDYVRTAYSKGLSWRSVRDRHALPNILIPILNTLGSSLRFSLASLPVVEVFFDWPGVGATLLDAIYGGSADLVIDLILSLGLFFLIVNLLIEFCFPLIDARLRRDPGSENRADRQGIGGQIRDLANVLSAMVRDLLAGFGRRRRLPALAAVKPLIKVEQEPPHASRRRWLLGHFIRNPALIVGLTILLGMIFLAAFGERLSPVSPYEAKGIALVEGVIAAPPFHPSATFPWGTDQLGRDMRALVLSGARRTLSLAFFGMLARLVLGTFLGLLAGWQRGGWFDRLVTRAMGVWAAFPITLFAMIVIQALGIQQGMWVFVVAISIVGWGEVAQFVRGQVVGLKPQPFIESARAVGARSDQILGRHVLPNLVNALIVLAALEMAGVLMLLAELGFLNIFMGGGFRAMIGEAGRMQPVIAFYSDVPEWAALIANVRQYWRTYPWMALYPGLAVFISIMGFNLLGEGLRRFLEDSQANLSRLFNRYTLIAALSVGGIAAAVLQSAGPMSLYRPEGLRFDEQRVMHDIRMLSAAETQGRETGTSGAELAAMYIGQRMAETGIFPAGQHNDYYQRLVQPRLHLREAPTLAIEAAAGMPAKEYVYRSDFAEVARRYLARGTAEAPVMGAAFGPAVDSSSTATAGFSNSEAMDHAIILRGGDLPKISTRQISAVLVVADGEEFKLERRDVYPYASLRSEDLRPLLVIAPEVADELLRTAGSSLAELDASRETLGPGELYLTASGATVSISVEAELAEDYLHEEYINVLGVIPGQGRYMGTEDQVIVVGAYYDGLGIDPLGTTYSGANDNASGVALMLELARLLKETTYQPDKTIVFAAWAGGERQEGLSTVSIMNARPGAQDLTVETVLELSGVGYGTGSAISIGEESSYRLVNLFQEAASRYDVQTTTRGRGPHYDTPALAVFGGREATTLALSWDGSDDMAHTVKDIPEIIVPEHLRDVGRTAMLTLLMLAREADY